MGNIVIGENENWTNKLKIKQEQVSFPQYNESYSTFVPNFKILSAVVTQKKFDGEKSFYRQADRQTHRKD